MQMEDGDLEERRRQVQALQQQVSTLNQIQNNSIGLYTHNCVFTLASSLKNNFVGKISL